MKLKLFEYCMLVHPETDKDGKDIGKTQLLKEPTRLLAKDEQQVGMLAAREVPTEHLEHLERVEIIVRPF